MKRSALNYDQDERKQPGSPGWGRALQAMLLLWAQVHSARTSEALEQVPATPRRTQGKKMKIKHHMNWTGVQLVIIETVNRVGGATWKQIKSAVESEGWEPTDWLTQVRGPLQGLIDEGRVRRIDTPDKSESYELTSQEH
jgi:hypothetical protein